jgi:hypothetical protein
MGWGIGFALDPKGRVYCADGCKWRAHARDYVGFPVWPSALDTVLEEFEGGLHDELDMVRDEFPGTAAGLVVACDEALPGALGVYGTMTAEEKMLRHEKKTLELDRDLKQVREALASAQAEYKVHKAACALGPPTYKRAPKTRADELERQIAPLKLELVMERAAMNVDALMKSAASLKRLARLENKFSLT